MFYRSRTEIAGQAVTVLTADGGHALTLAASGEGIVTSIAGTAYTIATADVGKIMYVSRSIVSIDRC